MFKPKTRSAQLLVEELVDELMIYDVECNEVHCLNGTAVRIWQLCDGTRTVVGIARELNTDLSPEDAESLVWSALDQFAARHLLEGVEKDPLLKYQKPSGMTRRQMLLRTGIVVGGLLPLVDSIVSPEAALAASIGIGGATHITHTTPMAP
jgi:coenzyme PQQ synthesis protein D (PqqD)